MKLTITKTIDNPLFSPGQRRDNPTPKTIEAEVNIRESSIATMHARGQLDDPQYLAGSKFRAIYERAGQSGTRALDWRNEVVDGGKWPDGLHDSRLAALNELNRIKKDLGKGLLYPIVRKVAGEGQTIGWVAEQYAGRIPSQLESKHVGMLFRDGLDLLCVRWSLKDPKGLDNRDA